jgi:hypothetical protein
MIMEKNFRKIYLKKSDKVLLDIYENKRSFYEDEVLTTIEQILTERNVAFNKSDLLDVNSKDFQIKNVGYVPMTLGFITLLFSLYVSFINPYLMDVSAGIIFTILVRVAFIAYAVKLCEDYEVKSANWLIAVLVFSSWAIIFLNFHILSKTSNSNTENEGDDYKSFSGLPQNIKVQPELSADGTPIAKPQLINCPACLQSLNGTSRCEACDLEF